ncbi:hypothetical protein AArcSl_2043 [Halalkaliarchaeum desulfuricum]|uniref:Uncharacterized protein n=1 Tax=Halalkaliarchaeum desulfuricum TaxID=2055893 RepID=A0A343TKP6_9EURY|nr:hypothetical protein [Halalkaliarchaeum desulfuricum]AUX09668.1 hypothetical protein AArcSl_2043 [Halalkaliarchaeum desulfuricum]
MPDRLPSDADAVSTTRAHVDRFGGTRRRCVRLGEELDVSDGDLVRLVLDRKTYHSRVHADANGLLLRGAYENRRLARSPTEGDNELRAWLEEVGKQPGDSLEVDEVVAGELYGLRIPGSRTVYSVTRGPASSLSEIARDLDG